MAFGNVIEPNPATHANSEAGRAMAKLNELAQRENGDIRYVLDLNNPDDTHIRYNSTSGDVEVYKGGAKVANW